MEGKSQHIVYFSLGTNLGDRQKNLERAAELIGESCGKDMRSSLVYQSRSWGYESRNDYYNQCLKVETELDPKELLVKILEIEQVMGRERSGMGYADRIIDIDILFYNGLVYESDQLVIPHPKIHERMFVLKPMLELDPEFVHPSFQATVSELYENCSDILEVRKV